FATNFGPGPATATDESGQSLTFDLKTDNDALFFVLPQINSNTGTLVFYPTPNAYGTVTVTVTLSDGETSSTQTFTITITPVADTPSVTSATTNEDVQTTDGLVIK